MTSEWVLTHCGALKVVQFPGARTKLLNLVDPYMAVEINYTY